MARSRTWNLRLNLDKFNAGCAALSTDAERSHFLAGLSRGLNGGSNLEGASLAFVEGYVLGHEARMEAEDYRQGRAEIGRQGGWHKHKTKGEPCGITEVTAIEPSANQTDRQSTIQNPLITNHEPPTTTSQPAVEAMEEVQVATGEKIRSVEGRIVFQRIWDRWPKERPGGANAKGHRIEAESAFANLIETGIATVEELEKVAANYLTHHPNVKRGYAVAISHFFDLDDRRGLLLETLRNVREHRPDIQHAREFGDDQAVDQRQAMRQAVRAWSEMGVDMARLEEDDREWVISQAKRHGWTLAELQTLPELRGMDFL